MIYMVNNGTIKNTKSTLIVSMIFILLPLFISGCKDQASNNDNKDRSGVLFENVAAQGKEEYRFEQIPWFTSKEELLSDDHIPSKQMDYFSENETIVLKSPVEFEKPNVKAKVLYRFFHDRLIGGEYHIESDENDELVRIFKELRAYVKENFPEPDMESSVSEGGLSDEAIRRDSASAEWWYGDNNIQSSSFSIGMDGNKIAINVSAPVPSDEILEKLKKEGVVPEDYDPDEIE